MEIPAEVLVHNSIMGLKGTNATLIRVSDEGYYEVNLNFGANKHRVLLPINQTILIVKEPEDEGELAVEVER